MLVEQPQRLKTDPSKGPVPRVLKTLFFFFFWLQVLALSEKRTLCN